MPTLTVDITDRGALGGIAGVGLSKRLEAFVKDVRSTQKRAAARATAASRAKVKRKRDEAPPRPGRYSNLKDALQWNATQAGNVALDEARLQSNFPVWRVQEQGTGPKSKAIVRVGGVDVARGRPSKRSVYTIKSQVGRRISPGLVFASGGKYAPPVKGGGTQQLYLRSTIRDAPIHFDSETKRSVAGIRIKREIPGQHFVQTGAREGFRELEVGVLAAARSQLRKRRT